MKIIQSNKSILKLDEADNDFIRKFFELLDEYASSSAHSFKTFLLNNYEISEADIDKLMKLYMI